MNQLDETDLRKNLDSILSTVKTRVYNTKNIGDYSYSTNKKIFELPKSLENTCMESVNVQDTDYIITLEVNRMAVAASTLRKRFFENTETPYLEVNMTCSIDHTNLKSFVMRDVELFAISVGVPILRVNVPFFGSGYSSLRNIDMDKLVEAYESDGYVVSREDVVLGSVRSNPVGPLPPNNNTVETNQYDFQMWKILNMSNTGVLPGWSNSGSSGVHVSDLSQSEIVDLPLRVNQFMGMINVKSYEVGSDEYRSLMSRVSFSDLDKACQKGMTPEYIEYDMTAGKYIITVEVSNTIVSFVLVTDDTGGCIVPHSTMKRKGYTDSGCLKVDILCASEFSGLGRFTLLYAEDFARKNGFDTVSLEALLDKTVWYRNQGYMPGDSNDVRMTPNVRGEPILDIIDRVGKLSSGKGIPKSIPKVVNIENHAIQNIISGILGKGYDVEDFIRANPGPIDRWNQAVKKYGSSVLSDGSMLFMSKIL